jgi:glycosyltransferase involved in cell wall biosynthesis
MQQSGIGMAARTAEDWRVALERYMNDEAARRDAGERGRRFAEEHYGFEKIFDQWDSVIKSVLH